MAMSDEETPKLTPEEYEVLSKSPADAPHLMEEGDGAADAPEGVVEDDADA